MPELEFNVVDQATFADIPAPAQPGARCQTCDYWERLDGGRGAPEADARDAAARESLKRGRLLGSRASGGALAMLACATDGHERTALAYAQFGPLSEYPRAQAIRDRYPALPESPAPWVVTCLQVSPSIGSVAERTRAGTALLVAVCEELDRRGITAVEAYPERAGDPWLPSPGPAAVYETAGFQRAVGDDRYPVFRRELSGDTDAIAWADFAQAAQPEAGDDWPLPLRRSADADDFFRLPPEKPRRRNPFGDD